MSGSLRVAPALVILLVVIGMLPPDQIAALAPAEQTSSFTPSFQQVARGLFQPLFITHAGDGSGRLFIVEKGGAIRIMKNGQVLPTPFLQISGTGGFFEQGLLGLAFHPNYARPGAPGYGRFFIYHTGNNGGTNALASYRVSATNPDQADPTSAQVLFSMPDPFENHNGGMLAFGPDGYLYVGTGDGGGGGDPFGNSQNKGELFGKLLRLDVDGGMPYAIPPSNPFVGQAGVRPEIWAYGMRNPWRFSFDRATGDLYIGDVGQLKWEEVDLQRAGAPGGRNYGWNIMEGTHCYGSATCDQTGITLPIHEYDHSLGCAVTGGYVYRGTKMPALVGSYIFGDYCGRVWALRQNSSGAWVRTDLLRSTYRISSFGEDQDGELYMADIWGGAVYRLVDPSAPTTPTPTLDPSLPTVTPTVTPTASSTPTPFTGPGPDLVITSFVANPAPSNQPMLLTVTVANNGTLSTTGGGFDVHVFADLGRAPTPADVALVAHFELPSIAPGASATATTYVYADSLTPGDHTLWALADGHGIVQETDENNNVRSIDVTVLPPDTSPSDGRQTVTFDDRAGQDQPLDGQYPTSLIDWGSGAWYLAGAQGALTSKSVHFRYAWQTNVAFTLLAPWRLSALQVFNAGTSDTTLSVSCGSLPVRQLTIGVGQRGTIETGWIQPCARVTVRSSNGLSTSITSVTLDTASGATATPTSTQTPTRTPTPTATPTGTATPTSTPGTSPSGSERLTNGGFESDLAGWTRSAGAEGVAGIDTAVVHSGGRAFRFSGRAQGPYLQQDVSAGPGPVSYAGWVNVPAFTTGSDGRIELVALNANRSAIATFRLFTIAGRTDGWVPLTGTQTLPPGTVTLRLSIRFVSLNATVYLDDLSIVQ